MSLAPIALFTYNRPRHTAQTVEALLANELAAQSDLYVFSDGAKSAEDAPQVGAVRRYLDRLDGFRSITITKRSRNMGLAESIIAGVTEVCSLAGKIIVLEDDLLTSPHFLSFMNESLDLYENDPEVIAISSYVYPHRVHLPETFFIRGADCWGWATWQRGWNMFNPDATSLFDELVSRDLTTEFDFRYYPYTRLLQMQILGQIDSWAIRWYASAFLRDKLTLYPGTSLVQNIGFDGSGTHSHSSSLLLGPTSDKRVTVRRLPFAEDGLARREFERYFRRMRVRRLWAGAMAVLHHPRKALGAVRRVARQVPSQSDDD